MASGLKIGIVAGEASGDILGGRLMAAIRERQPDVQFSGVGGDTMLAEGLSVNGIKDPLLRLPSLYRLLRRLVAHFVGEGVDAVVGVDFNVFNLMMERRVRQRGIPTAHYVSPSVYFWRQGRVKRIVRAADVVLTLFPFEPAFYEQRGGRAVFVGHPLADDIGLDDGADLARRRNREALGIEADRCVIALLPGSRRSEIAFMGQMFLDAARHLNSVFANPLFLVPTPTRQVVDDVEDLLRVDGNTTGLAVRVPGSHRCRRHGAHQIGYGHARDDASATSHGGGLQAGFVDRVAGAASAEVRLRRPAEHPCGTSVGAGTSPGGCRARTPGEGVGQPVPACRVGRGIPTCV
ncbi:MAG: hypothetical protein J4F45_02575 [Pseudomonadales bacterium]|nr:hypothetical protein [Pseudomonadales bacterium]